LPCWPVWHTDAYTLATRREVRAGDEITVDYAIQTAESSFRMSRRCGAATCRRIVTGSDWREPEWASHYRGHVVPAIARRIDEE
jgi:hypothetical protein